MEDIHSIRVIGPVEQKQSEKSVKIMLGTAGGLYFAQLSVKFYGGRASTFKIDIDEDKMFDEVKISATLWIPASGLVLVSAQDKQKLYLVNPTTQNK